MKTCIASHRHRPETTASSRMQHSSPWEAAAEMIMNHGGLLSSLLLVLILILVLVKV
jgi:hypothetical protein